MKLGKLIAAIKQDLPITPRHEAWLSSNPSPSYSDTAKSFLSQEIGKPQRDRSAAFSASGSGTCHRRRVFSFLGLPESSRLSGRTTSIFHNGTYTHLRWQMAGISAGWLAQPEVFAQNPELRIKGSLDGILDTGEGFELKSINARGFDYVNRAEKPKRQHVGQVGAYFVMMPEIEAFSVVYENKDTQDYKEFVVRRDREREVVVEARDELDKLNSYVEDRRLPEQKDACWAEEGSEYLQCPFRQICPKMRDWDHVVETAIYAQEDRLAQAENHSESPEVV